MDIRQRIEKFNREQEPFYIVDHDDRTYSLCLTLNFMKVEYENFGQEAFNQYALSQGEPIADNGYFSHGDGHEWKKVFKKAFEKEDSLKKITFDCELGGFYCDSDDLSVLEDFGSRFRTMCEDQESFAALVQKALTEAEQQEDYHDKNRTVKWCIQGAANASMEIVTAKYCLMIEEGQGTELSRGNDLSVKDKNTGRMVLVSSDRLLNYRVSDIKDDMEHNHIYLEAEPTDEKAVAVHPLLTGYCQTGNRQLCSIQEVAEFICEQGMQSDLKITYDDGAPFLNTFGIYIDKIADMEYRKRLLEVLIPMQMKIDRAEEIGEISEGEGQKLEM